MNVYARIYAHMHVYARICAYMREHMRVSARICTHMRVYARVDHIGPYMVAYMQTLQFSSVASNTNGLSMFTRAGGTYRGICAYMRVYARI